MNITHEPVVDVTRFVGKPLAIIGAGPSYSGEMVSWIVRSVPGLHIFALNHTITELFKYPRTWWVSNDHDRTFGNENIREGILPLIKDYAPWRTITQRLFIPGPFGDLDWIDHRGVPREPMKFRLPCPDGTHVAWYLGGNPRNKPCEGYVRNGHSVLELALEVATLWGFDPIVLVGCDMFMPTPETYYAEPFRWKETPRRIVHGKLNKARDSIIANRTRWKSDIFSFSKYWEDGPFDMVNQWEAVEKFTSV